MFTRIKILMLTLATLGVCFAPFALGQDSAKSVTDLIQGVTSSSESETLTPSKASPVAQAVLGAIERTSGSSDTINKGQRAQAIQEALEPFKIAKDIAKEEKREDKLTEKVEKAMAKAIEKNLSENDSFTVSSFKEDGKGNNSDPVEEREKAAEEKIKRLVAGLAGFSKKTELEKLDSLFEKRAIKEEKIVAKAIEEAVKLDTKTTEEAAKLDTKTAEEAAKLAAKVK